MGNRNLVKHLWSLTVVSVLLQLQRFDVGAASETFRYLKIIKKTTTLSHFFTDAGSFESCHKIYL